MRFGAWMLSLVVGASLLTGCAGNDSSPIGGKDRPAGQKAWQTFVSLSPSSSEIAGLVLGKRVIGRTESCNWPMNVASAAVVVQGITPSFERIKELRPEAVIYDSTLYKPEVIQKIKDLGFPTFDTSRGTVESHMDMLAELGKASGAESMVSENLDKITRQIQDRSALVTKNPKVTVVLPGPGGQNLVLGTESFVADMIKRLNAQPVGTPGKLYGTMNAEAFVRANPDIIIIAGTAEEAKPFVSDPRFRSMAAFRNGKLVSLKEKDVLLRQGARVDTLADQLGAAIARSQ
jgi:iron complex transport system substrate-binding protein